VITDQLQRLRCSRDDGLYSQGAFFRSLLVGPHTERHLPRCVFRQLVTVWLPPVRAIMDRPFPWSQLRGPPSCRRASLPESRRRDCDPMPRGRSEVHRKQCQRDAPRLDHMTHLPRWCCASVGRDATAPNQAHRPSGRADAVRIFETVVLRRASPWWRGSSGQLETQPLTERPRLHRGSTVHPAQASTCHYCVCAQARSIARQRYNPG
jgi:hypothetical protein